YSDLLARLDAAYDSACEMLCSLEERARAEPTLAEHHRLSIASGALGEALERWSNILTPLYVEEAPDPAELSEESLDVQRELAFERRQLRYTPQDYDADQIAWLEASLAESIQDRPDAWRVVYLHHPLFTTIANHC